MTQKKYPAYKPSSTEWLGEVPSHWKVMRLRFILASDGVKIGPFGSALKYEYIKDQGIKIYGQEHVIKDDFSLGKKYIDSEKFAELETYELLSGDVIVTMMGTTGKCKVFPEGVERGIMDSHLTRLRTKLHEYLPQLLALIINDSHLIYSQIKWFSKGSIMEGLNSTIIKSLYIPIPPLEEQKQILKYITEKKEKIDSTIRQKERLIELLQEERTAIINQAVTRGLDPNVKMKDSGVEWLGKIPEHWKKTRLKTVLLKIGSGVTPKGGAEVYQTSGIPILRSQNIHFDGLRLDDVAYITEDIHRSMNSSRVVSGDVLLNITGASIGRSFYVDDLLGEANVNQHVCILRPDNDVNTKYLYYFLASELSQLQIALLQTGANREGLNFEQLGNFLLPLPNIEVQKKIVKILDQKVQSLNNLSSKVQTEIRLLKEYRTVLINEVVTGKRCVT